MGGGEGREGQGGMRFPPEGKFKPQITRFSGGSLERASQDAPLWLMEGPSSLRNEFSWES